MLQISTVQRAAVVFIIGTMVSIFFCFIIYPEIQLSHHAELDADQYGQLGINIFRGFGLSYNHNDGQTIYRGPLYPAFIAFILKLFPNSYPKGIWIAQSILNGITCVFTYLIADRCWGKSIAIVSGIGCGLYPVLFWNTPRMWNEGLVTLLLTALIYLTIIINDRCTTLKAVMLGIIIGLLCLIKATFLPLIFVIPVVFYIFYRNIKYAIIILLLSIIIIMPWTVRNILLTGKVIPIHIGIGFNLKMGNIYANDFFSNPFSYAAIWDKNIEQVQSIVGGGVSHQFRRELEEETAYMQSAIADIKSNYLLIFKKMIVAGVMFWYIGETPIKTMVQIVLRLPILILALLRIINIIIIHDKKLYLSLIIILVYWMSHLPFAPPCRLSVPVFPILLVFAISSLPWITRQELIENDKTISE